MLTGGQPPLTGGPVAVDSSSTSEADPGIFAPNDLVSKQQGIDKGTKKCSFDHIIADEFNTSPDLSSSNDAKKEIKLEDLSKLILNREVDFIDLESPEYDKPIIVQDEDEEVHAEKTLNSKLVKEKEDAEIEASLLKAQPSFPNVEKLTELLLQSLKPKLSKLLTSHDFSNSLPTKLKELPSKFKDITGVIRELKKYVEKLEIKLLGDLKEIPTKMEKFNSTISSLTTQVSELRTLKWELPTEFLVVPGQVSSVQSNMSKVKVLDALP
ncbi:hypothetical protein Tco_0572898, partial [Tanacetum coccineum]